MNLNKKFFWCNTVLFVLVLFGINTLLNDNIKQSTEKNHIISDNKPADLSELVLMKKGLTQKGQLWLTPSASQVGTDIDGALNTDADGNFIPDRDVWQLFEYFLLDRSLHSEEQIYQQIKAFITVNLPEPARSQALAFLQQYQNYYQELRYEPVEMAEASWKDRLNYLNSIREQAFGAEVAAKLFGSETQQNKVGLAMIEGEAMDVEQLPERIRHKVLEQQKHQQLKQDVEAMRAANLDEGQIWLKRAEVLGEEAADRWQALDAKRAKQQVLIKIYEQEKQQLVEKYGNDSQRIEALIMKHFSGSEQRRMLAKERLGNF